MNQRTWPRQNNHLGNLDWLYSTWIAHWIILSHWCGTDFKKNIKQTQHYFYLYKGRFSPTSPVLLDFFLGLLRWRACVSVNFLEWKKVTWVSESSALWLSAPFCDSDWNLKQIIRIFPQFKNFINKWECVPMISCCSVCLPSFIYSREIRLWGVKRE